MSGSSVVHQLATWTRSERQAKLAKGMIVDATNKLTTAGLDRSASADVDLVDVYQS